MTHSSIRQSRALKGMIGALTFVIFMYALFRRLDNDEIEALHTAWKVLHDGTIFQDFFQHHHPFLYYLLAPLIKIFGPTTNIIYLARTLMFSMFLGMGYATYLLAKTITNRGIAFGERIGLVSVLLLYSLPVFTVKAIEIRPDVPMMVCALFAVFFWFRYLQEDYSQSQKYGSLIASALLLSASFLFLQKAIFLIFFLGLIMLAQFAMKKTTFKDLALYGATFALLPLIYLGYLLATGTFASYLTFCWLFNQKMLGGCPAWHSVRFAILTNIPFWIAFITGTYYGLKNRSLGPLFFLAAGLVAVFFVVPYSFSQYLLPALPFISIIAAYGLCTVTKQNAQVLLLLTALIVIPPISTNYVRRVILSPVSEQIKKINYVLSITNEDDYVLDSEIGFGGFNLFRKDIDFFWIGTLFVIPTYNLMNPKPSLADHYNVYKLIEEKKPKVVARLSITKIPQACIDTTKAYVITEQYEQSDHYEDLLIRREP